MLIKKSYRGKLMCKRNEKKREIQLACNPLIALEDKSLWIIIIYRGGEGKRAISTSMARVQRRKEGTLERKVVLIIAHVPCTAFMRRFNLSQTPYREREGGFYLFSKLLRYTQPYTSNNSYIDISTFVPLFVFLLSYA